MSTVLINGFETGDLDTCFLGNQLGGSHSIVQDTRGPHSGYAAQCFGATLASTVPFFGTPLPASLGEMYFGVGFKRNSSHETSNFIQLESSGGITASINDTDVGVLTAVYAGGSSSSSLAYDVAKWHYLEVYFLMLNTGGRFVIKVDGTIFIDVTADTDNGLGNIYRLRLCGVVNANSPSSRFTQYDDLIVNSAAGTVNNSWPNDTAVVGLHPNAAGDITQLNVFPVPAGATRMYLGANATDVPAFAPDASWENQGAFFRADLLMESHDEVGTVNRQSNVTLSGTQDNLMMQYISPPLAAQTLSPAGAWTVKGQIRGSEQLLSSDVMTQLNIRVLAPDGTVRGTMLAHNTGALSSEFTQTPAITNRQLPRGGSTALSQVVASAGDRLVVEVGVRATGDLSAGVGATLRIGNHSTLSDLPEDETSTSDFNPWIEFSGTVTLLAENWWAVAEADPSDDDSTYVWETVKNDRDLYNATDVPAQYTVVKAVALKMRAKEVEAGSGKIAAVVKSGTTEVAGTDQQVTTIYDWYDEVYDKDPSDSNPWTQTKLNALQIGVKVR